MRTPPKWLTACFLLAAALFIYLQLFIWPVVPVMCAGDQTIWLLNGRRMLDGEVMYRDIFQFLFPGTETVNCGLFKLFGVRAWVPNAALIFLGTGLTWTSVAISRRIFRGASGVLAGLLFLVIVFRGWLGVGTHHWYSTLAVMAALAVLIPERNTRRLLAAGALCGLSAWFDQTRGLAGLLGFGVFLLWEGHEKKETWRPLFGGQARLFGSFLVTVGALTSYFIWTAGLKRFLYSTVIFLVKYLPLDTYATWRAYGADFPGFDAWYKTPALGSWMTIHLMLPLIYIVFFYRAWREKTKYPQEPWDRLMLLSLVGLFLFIGVAPAALDYRLGTVSLPAFILLVWFAKWPGKIERVVLPLLWAGGLALMIMETRALQTRPYEIVSLPTGRAASFHHAHTVKWRWFLAHVRPSDYLFGDPDWSFPLGVRTPAQVDFVTPTGFTRPEQVQNVVERLEATNARWVLWDGVLDFQLEPGNHLGPLRGYLHRQYHLAKTFDDSWSQVWERNE